MLARSAGQRLPHNVGSSDARTALDAECIGDRVESFEYFDRYGSKVQRFSLGHGLSFDGGLSHGSLLSEVRVSTVRALWQRRVCNVYTFMLRPMKPRRLTRVRDVSRAHR